VITMLRMACESTGRWNGSDREYQLSIVEGIIVISWVCRCFFFRGDACFIVTEVVVGAGFWALWMPHLEWLAWPLAWLREFVEHGTWLS